PFPYTTLFRSEDLTRPALEVLLAQLRREDDRRRRLVRIAHPVLGLGAAHRPHVGMLPEELQGGARQPAPVFVPARDQQPGPPPAVEEPLRDDGDHEDRHQEGEDECRTIPEEDAEVFAEEGQRAGQAPPRGGAGTFARRRSRSPWKESFFTAASNWARKFLARLTPATTMSVVRPPWGG